MTFLRKPVFFSGEYQNGIPKWYSDFGIKQEKTSPDLGEDKTTCQKKLTVMDNLQNNNISRGNL